MITMGNDEFILYIRKNYPDCSITNEQLGKQIWKQIKDSSGAKKLKEDHPAYWGNQGTFLDALKLPKTAAQFSFDRKILPDLFNFLDELGDNNS